MLNWKTVIHRASTKILADINLKCYEIAWELFTSVVKLTPSPSNPGKYSKGLLANQWYPKEGSASAARSAALSSTGADSLARINAVAKNGTEFYTRDGKITLTNNTDYAYRAEFLGWPKPTWRGEDGDAGFGGGGKPYRMVARSLIAVSAKYKRVKI